MGTQGEAGAHKETVRTYGRPGCVPTGDEFHSKPFLHKHIGILDCKEDCTTDTTHRVVCGSHGLRQERSPAMVTQASVPVLETFRPSPRTPLRILRTETVLSRFPIHNLTTHGRVSIHLQRTNVQGELDYLWDVSTSTHYGPPGPLAYKLDTLVINQRLDALPRPVPSVLKVGSLRQVAPQLGLNTSGRQQEHLK